MTLCSSCQEVVRPVAAFDIDGTLAEYHDALRLHVERYWSLPPGQTGPNPWNGEGNYEDYLGVTQEQYREAKLAFRQGGFKRWSTPMEGLDKLRKTVTLLKKFCNLEVWITTTRPWNRLDSVDPDTRWWLDRHFPMYDHLLYDEHKYLRLAEIVDPERVVLVVEDLPEMHKEAKEVFSPSKAGIVIRPHNLDYARTQAWVTPVYGTLSDAAQSLEVQIKR